MSEALPRYFAHGSRESRRRGKIPRAASVELDRRFWEKSDRNDPAECLPTGRVWTRGGHKSPVDKSTRADVRVYKPGGVKEKTNKKCSK